MTKLVPKDGISALTEVIRDNDGREYPVDFVRKLFINTDETLEEMATQMNLPIEIVKLHAERGLDTWHKLRQDRLSQRMKYFLDYNIDNLLETHSVLEDGHFLTLVQMKGQQEFLKTYYKKHGHLFRLEPDEVTISKDHYGMPIPLPIPNGPKNLMILEAMLKIKEGTKAAMNQVFEAAKETKSKTLDLDSSGIFEEEET